MGWGGRARGREELCGITKAIYDAKHLGAAKQNTLYLEIMRHVVRTDVVEKCAGFLEVTRTLFDVALSSYYAAQKKKGGRSAQLAPDQHKHISPLYGPHRPPPDSGRR